MAINWFKYSSPASFYSLAGKMIPVFVFISVILLVAGLYVGFFVAPTDFQQGEA
ncbi:MAG: heme ABC transporter permease, partial [Candidatus Nitrotoga sp.]